MATSLFFSWLQLVSNNKDKIDSNFIRMQSPPFYNYILNVIFFIISFSRTKDLEEIPIVVRCLKCHIFIH